MSNLRINSFKLVGRLQSCDMKEGQRSNNGGTYISGKAVVIANLGGRDNEFEVSFYANQLTSDKQPSKLFASYSKMPTLIGKKVDITGEIRESRFFSRNSSQMVSSQTLSGRFLNVVSDSTADVATFELGGFIVKELQERTNKSGEVYRYDLSLGQANYNGTSMQCFVVHVNPVDREIIAGVRGYHAGDTVRVNGDLNFLVETVTSERKNDGGFGEGVVRTFTNRIHNFWVKGGSAALGATEEGVYDRNTITALVSAYKAHDVELAAAAKGNGDEPAVEKPVASRQTSLI